MRKDGTEYRVDELKYTCYHKSRKLNDCDGQTSYKADRIDATIINVLEELFRKIKDTPKDKALERRYKSQLDTYNSKYKKISAEIEKLETQLKSLKMEIGKALVGESAFTADQLSEAIKETQSKLLERESEQEKLKSELDNKKEAMGKLDYYYNQFLGWANEFENAPKSFKIICCKFEEEK